MRINNILEKKGFRDMIIKSVVFIGLLALMQVLIQPLSAATPLPEIFKPFSLIYLEDTILFVFAVFAAYNWKQLAGIKKYKLSISGLLFIPVGALFVGAYYALKFSLNTSQFWFEHVWAFIALKYLFLALMVLSFFAAAFGREMICGQYRIYKRQVPYLLGTALGYWMISSFIEGMWHVFSGTVAWMVYSLLKLSYPGASMTPGVDGPSIVAGGFGARIGSLCSGIESMMLFSALFVIIVAVDFDKIDVKRALIVFFPALAGVFLLNVVRIYLLFLVAINVSRDIAVGMFHTNAGYILFCAYFFMFLWFAYPWMIVKNSRKK